MQGADMRPGEVTSTAGVRTRGSASLQGDVSGVDATTPPFGGSRSCATADARERVPPGCLPVRRRPSHHSIVVRAGVPTVVFATVCVKDKIAAFLDPTLVERLVAVWRLANKWRVGRYVVMPDHVHFLCAPNVVDCSFRTWMAYWKSTFSKGLDWAGWQRDCWDVQIRDQAHFAERVEYMKMNPVRAGLAESPEAWSYQGAVDDVSWHV